MSEHVTHVTPVPITGPSVGLAGYTFVCSCGTRGDGLPLTKAAAQQAAVEHAVGHPVTPAPRRGRRGKGG